MFQHWYEYAIENCNCELTKTPTHVHMFYVTYTPDDGQLERPKHVCMYVFLQLKCCTRWLIYLLFI